MLSRSPPLTYAYFYKDLCIVLQGVNVTLNSIIPPILSDLEHFSVKLIGLNSVEGTLFRLVSFSS